MISGQPAIRVAVNDRQLSVAAVMENGRVLVPFRAVVEALGGNVSEFRLPLPPPARIIAGRTYAPIRYLANALHAQIQYDGREHLVQVFTSQPATVGDAQPTPGLIPGINPPANSNIGSAYPTISASLPLPSGEAIRSLRMLLDGIDVSAFASYAGTYVTFIPRMALPIGTHTVTLNVTTTSGRAFDNSWSFTTTAPAAPDVADTSFLQPIQLSVSQTELTGGGRIGVELTAPPGGQAFAFSCTSSYQFPLFAGPTSQFYNGSVRIRDVNSEFDCPITAMYIGYNGQVTYAPYPVFVHLRPNTPRAVATPTPTPTPTPTRVPLPIPVHTRVPEPTATPEPTPTPRVFKPFPHQRATPTPEPEPTASPTPSPTPAAEPRREPPDDNRIPRPRRTLSPPTAARP